MRSTNLLTYLYWKNAFSQNVVCDLDLGTHDLENVITVMWTREHNCDKVH